MFLENFQTLISVMEDYGGAIGTDPSGANEELVVEGIDVNNASEESKRNATTNDQCQEQVPGYGHADCDRLHKIHPPARRLG
jgi:hypothetical protein